MDAQQIINALNNMPPDVVEKVTEHFAAKYGYVSRQQIQLEESRARGADTSTPILSFDQWAQVTGANITYAAC